MLLVSGAEIESVGDGAFSARYLVASPSSAAGTPKESKGQIISAAMLEKQALIAFLVNLPWRRGESLLQKAWLFLLKRF